MSYFHSHTICEHLNVKVCKICGEVYCPDCGKEWEPKWYYPYYVGHPYIITYGTYTYDNNGNLLSTSTDPNVVEPTVTAIAESHKHI